MSSHIEFVAVMGYDIVGAEHPEIPMEKKNQRKKILQNCLFESSTYQTVSSYANWIGTGDGGYLTVDTKDSDKLLDITKEMHDKLEIHNRSEENKDWHIKIRVGINVGPAEVTREENKIIKVEGNAIAYTERIMSLGKEDHILLTSSATTTILAIDHNYHDKIKYVGERTIKHGERFNVHSYIDGRYGNKKDPPADPPTNQSSPYLKYSIIGLACVIAVAAVFVIAFIVTYPDDGNKQYLNDIRDNQFNTVKVSLTNKIQSFIDASHILENTVTVGYTENENKTLFIDKRVEELHNSNLFAINKKPIKNSLYFYILSPFPDCKFLLYPFKMDMSRTNATGLESCELVNLDLFITNNYPSTGAGTFVNTVSQKIRLDNDGGHDLTTGIAIDWDEVSEEIRRTSIKSSDVKFALVDREQFLVMECTMDKCKSTKSYAVENNPITKNSTYIRYNPINYEEYVFYKEETFQDKEFHMYDTLRNRILDGWRLIMYVTPSNP